MNIFTEIFKDNQTEKPFPGIRELKLIVRKVNKIARHLYERTGFIADETLNPKIYGNSYNERYMGYHLTLIK